MQVHRLAFVAALLATAGCATQPSRTASAANSRVVTEAELSAAPQANLYDFVSANRPRWLTPRSTGGRIPSGGARMSTGATPITVYVENLRMGGLEVLRSYGRDAVASMRYYDVSEAQQRFNDRNLGVVIQIVPK